ncbi:MAG: hypothetical protein HY814_03680 [Candidatus Riflebacteria bacterium]|nr:hypothetical protein [Candidatus Riflebacteria bacterium]
MTSKSSRIEDLETKRKLVEMMVRLPGAPSR